MRIIEIEPLEMELKKTIDLFKECFPIHNIFSNDEEFILEYLKKVEIVLGYEEENKLVGLVAVRKKENYYSINHLCVDEKFREKGIGTKLVEASQEFISELGGGIIKIVISNDKLFEFVTNLGFEFIDEKKDYYRKGDTVYIFKKKV